MLFWLYGFLARIAIGEQLEPGKRSDYRVWSAIFILFPLLIAGAAYFGRSFLDHANGFAIWIAATGFGIFSLAICALWARIVPAIVSFALGGMVWSASIWLAWHAKF